MKTIFAIFTVVLINNWATAQFTEISNTLPAYTVLQTYSYGTGISFYDFNGDGWDDLSIGNSTSAPLFFVNNEGTLQPATFSIPNANNAAIIALIWADVDNDGDPDIFITKEYAPPELWINDGNFNFTDMAAERGITGGTQRYMGASFCDYNHDGLLDLYICIYSHPSTPFSSQTSQLFRNNGNSFTDVTIPSGVYLPPRPTFQSVFTDVNGDGWEDLYLIIDRIEFRNELFINNGDGTFTCVSEGSGSDVYVCSMTGTVGDFDNDGDLDTYVTSNLTTGNVLLKNEGNNSFNEVAEEYGVVVDSYCWGSLWIDYDNDSWQDLFVGATQEVGPAVNYFFRNEQGVSFSNLTFESNVNSSPNKTYVCAKGDLNQDGYYDFATINRAPLTSKLHLNNGGINNYLSVTLKGTYSNPDGIGNWIHCYANGNQYVRFTHCGENLFAQDSGKNIFGLGTFTIVDTLVIKWNRGLTEKYYNVPVNQHLCLVEGGSFNQPFEIVANASQLCLNDSIELHAVSGENYIWNTGETTQSIVVNTPGTYEVTVFHGFGFSSNSIPIEITNAPIAEISTTIQDVNCFGNSNGSVLVDIENGTMTSINWSNGNNSSYLLGLSAGIYNYSLTDSYYCNYEGEIAIYQPDSISASVTLNHVSCFGENDGSIIVQPTGGTPPIDIYWLGYNPMSLFADSYTFLLVDFNACNTVKSFNILQPEALTLEVQTEHHIEGGALGSATAIIEGGTTPYFIVWSNGATGPVNDNLTAGNYQIEVTDAMGCTVVENFTIDFLTNMNDQDSQSFLIYPNPTQGVINIRALAPASVRLFDNIGKLHLETNINSSENTIDVTRLQVGVYFIIIQSKTEVSYFKVLIK
jgi:hypothetical protein